MKKGTLYYALDISADKIYALCAAVNQRTGEIIDVSCQCGPSLGIKNGIISELGLLAEAIALVLNKFSDFSGNRPKSLYVSMQGPNAKATHSIGIIPISERSNKIITSGDIARVNQQAYSLGLNLEEHVLHQISQGYLIDGQNKVADPAGLYGHKLEADLLLVTALNRDVENLISAVDRAGYRVRAVVLSAYAASLAVLPEGVKSRGCCLLDIGFESTQMLVFKDGVLRAFESFNFGSSHLTEALADKLKLPYDLAESIMTSYGSVLSAQINPEAEVLVNEKDKSYRPIKRKVICSIIENRLEELFRGIKERLALYRKTLDFPEGIIASGKTALLEGFLEGLEVNFGCPARLARIDSSTSLRINDLTYATCVGLIKYAISQRHQIELFKLSSYGNIFQKLTRKSKEIYQEYF